MDALDEFFGTWCEPEAWCEVCTQHPAIHVVLRDSEGKYGGVTSHVRVWDSETQMRLAVCRQCCQQHIDTLGNLQLPSQPGAHNQTLDLQSNPTRPQMSVGQWLHRLVRLGKELMTRYFGSRRC